MVLTYREDFNFYIVYFLNVLVCVLAYDCFKIKIWTSNHIITFSQNVWIKEENVFLKLLEAATNTESRM